ncbi:type II toxin-antitoxin system HicA family toxin [Nostoc sp. PCC 9305]|uniref:type II toxin-antitoxin system HicA family toxin n=1 Tax=Nostoc sp. PCC 9305 TaxID=296636 RepID=UPI0039C709A9
MSARIRRMTSREVETILRQYGFQFISQKGSHRKWRSEDLGLQVIVPEHQGHTLPIGTLRSIFQGAKIPESEWKS